MRVKHSLFISYAEEDGKLVSGLADALDASGYPAWYYQRHAVGGRNHVEQTAEATKRADVMLLLISPASVASGQVDTEVHCAHDLAKPILPLLRDLSYEDFREVRPTWHVLLRGAVAVTVPPDAPLSVVAEVVEALIGLGCWPRARDVAHTSGGTSTLRTQSRRVDMNLAVLSVLGEVDVANALQVRDHALSATQGMNMPKLVVDLSSTEYMDSAGLGTLVGLLKVLRERGGDLRLAAPKPRVRRLFEITGLDQIFLIFDSVEEAVRSADSGYM